MLSPSVTKLFSPVAILFLLPAQCWAWGNEGHRLVGAIAEAALAGTPAVMNRVHAVFGPNVHLSDLSTCADRIRDFVRDHGVDALDPQCAPLIAKFSTPQKLLTDFAHSDKWHFINIPFDGHQHSMSDVKTFCGSALCAPERIEHYRDTLSPSASVATDAEAILFLSHLVGDLHQPLHCAERNHDSGGNSVVVTIFQRSSKLHAVWDDTIIDHMTDGSGHTLPSEAARSAHLIASLPQSGPFNAWQWGLDAFQLAATVSYVNFGAVPLAQIPLTGTTLHDAAYLAQADPVTQKQLRLAGVRLAAILKEKLGN